MYNVILYPRFYDVNIYLGLNVPTAILAVIAIGGSMLLLVRIGSQYRIVSWLSFTSAMSLLLNQIFSFVSNMGADLSFVSAILAMFFQNIFPLLLWCLLFGIINITAHSSLQVYGPGKQMNGVFKTVRVIYLWTGILIVLNIISAVIEGIFIGGGGLALFTAFHILTDILPVFTHCITFFTMMYKGNHYQDIRSFKGSFITVLILSTIAILGPLVYFGVSYAPFFSSDYYTIVYTVYTVMVRICGAIALCIIVFMLPQKWLQGLREYEIRNKMDESNLFPEDDEVQDQTWNSNHLYDPQPQQKYVNIHGPQNTNSNNKPDAY
ncbi:hypothetical protein BDC45DRAFT_505391 [Circinella umbellata]|nr:hypothetical protein BDC45DRAFT_505391 [Circinella umbellata]